ncbi:MAG TPA: potassium-transporting ATPase subunit B, partial [Acidimicrobiales bacterium]|nr:potassium-transporting ATPase subunit B [Acidimicrobiales bacterium]
MTTDILESPRIEPHSEPHRHVQKASLFERAIVKRALVEAFVKLDPRYMLRKPVIFVVYVGSIWSTVIFFWDVGSASSSENVFLGSVVVWLWLTVLFATFADAMAEGRGKAQADSLRRTRQESMAQVLQPDGSLMEKRSVELAVGDHCVIEAGQLIPGDGDVIEGMALVDESAITGESAPVIRESGGDRTAVTGGTRVLSDRIVIEVTAKPGETFLDRMISLVEGAERQKTPNELALTVVLVSLTFIFIVAVATFQPFAIYS